jgi:hypothetical protein
VTGDDPCDAETLRGFIATYASEVSSLALAFAHEPEDKTSAALDEMRSGMEAGLAEIWSADTAADLCGLFLAEVRRRKSEIEAASLGGRA